MNEEILRQDEKQGHILVNIKLMEIGTVKYTKGQASLIIHLHRVERLTNFFNIIAYSLSEQEYSKR